MGNEVARTCGGGPNQEEMRKIREYDMLSEEKKRMAEELETNKKLADDYITYKSKTEPTLVTLTQKEKLASDHVVELETRVRDVTAERDQLRSQLEEKKLKIEELNQRIDSLYSRLGASTAEEDKNSTEASSLATALRKTEEQLSALQMEVSQLRTDLSTHQLAVQELQSCFASAEQDNIATIAKIMEFVSSNQGIDNLFGRIMDFLNELDSQSKVQREARERRILSVMKDTLRKQGKDIEEARRATEAALRMREEARKAADIARKQEEEARLARLDAEPVAGKCSLTFIDLYNVRMQIVSARNLPPAEDRQRNLYATVKVNDGLRKTKVISDSLSPEWKQPFGFITEKMPKQLRFDVWDQTNDENQEHLGGVTVDLIDLFNGKSHGEISDFLPLVDARSGDLCVKIICKRVPQATLRWPAGYGHDDIAKVLRFANTDVDAREKGGRTPLMQASLRNLADVARTLLVAGANIEAKDSNGLTPLMLASIYGSSLVIPVLIEFKCNIEALDSLGRSPLSLAAKNGRVEVARMLLESKADINTVDSDGLTPLMIASVEGHTEVVRMLVEYGADVRQKNRAGLNPLMMAAVRDYPQIAKLCIERGCDPNERDAMGMSPLMIASVRGNLEVVKILIEARADLNPSEVNGRTPLMFASHMGRYDVVRALLDAGADTSKVDSDGRTCLQIAMDNRQANVVRLLQQWASENAAQPGN